MSKKINRKELYDLMWSKSWFVLTDQFDLSRFRLLKICKENRIPPPSDDWWTESTIKEIAHKPELYADDSYREDAMIEIFSDREIRQKRINEIKEDIEESCGDYLPVPKRLFKTEQLILNAKYSNDINISEVHREDSGPQVSIFVTKKNVSRSLRILDTFIKLIKGRGHSIEVVNHQYMIHIGNDNYEFSIREKHNRVESNEKWHDHDLEPTGLLIITIGGASYKKEFVDTRTPLEQKLSAALAYLEYISEVRERNREDNEKQRLKREEEERITQKIKEKEAQEIERFDNLLKQAKAWNQAKLLREFISEVESRSNEINQVPENVKEWVKWAMQKVEEYDPLNNVKLLLEGDKPESIQD